jgi:hypothetical protein
VDIFHNFGARLLLIYFMIYNKFYKLLTNLVIII